MAGSALPLVHEADLVCQGPHIHNILSLPQTRWVWWRSGAGARAPVGRGPVLELEDDYGGVCLPYVNDERAMKQNERL